MTGCHYNSDSLSLCCVKRANFGAGGDRREREEIMASERFYRLPEEKRRVICDAAFREFARVPIDKVSINRIIRDADISRGSFYTYFEDKWDLLRFIMEEMRNAMQANAGRYLRESDGDVWYMLRATFEDCLVFYRAEETKSFVENVVNYVNSSEMFGSSRKTLEEFGGSEANIHAFYETYILKKGWNLSYGEAFSFLQLAMMVIGMAMRDSINGTPEEEVREHFENMLTILQYGVTGRAERSEENQEKTEEIVK